MTQTQSLDCMMEPVARALLGEPNAGLSKGESLRFGANGSIEVNTKQGWFNDYETDTRGGVMALIEHKAGIADHASAFRWLEEQGIKEATQVKAAPTPPCFYDYRDEAGAVAFRVERRGKGHVPPYLQHGPDGNGGFVARGGIMQGVRLAGAQSRNTRRPGAC